MALGRSEAALAAALLAAAWLLRRRRAHARPIKPIITPTPPPPPRGRLLILWGSQTGTAEAFASVLEREARERGFDAQALDLEEYEAESLPAEPGLVLLLMSTHGEGEPPDNAARFFAWLAGAEPGSMAGLSYGAFALGNRQYEQFCTAGIQIDERLGSLGGTRLVPLGLGDDDDDLEADFAAWRADLWLSLGCAHADAPGALEPRWAAEFLPGAAPGGADADGEAGWAAEWAGSAAAAAAGCDAAPAASTLPLHTWMAAAHPRLGATPVAVLANRELQAAGSPHSTRHLELALAPPAAGRLGPPGGPLERCAAAGAFRGARALRYAMADSAGLYAQNARAAVRRAAALLGVQPAALFALRPAGGAGGASGPPPFPTPCSVGRVLRWYADLSAPPSKAFLCRLAAFCADEGEAAALRRLGSEAESAAYASWAIRGRRSVLDALEAAPSAALPWAAFVELCPRMQPRYYTVSSSPLAAPASLHLTVKVLSEPADRLARPPAPLRVAPTEPELRAPFAGVCSTYLAAARAPPPAGTERAGRNGYAHAAEIGSPDLVLAFVRRSVFRLPARAETPLLMVGAGTGVAPFRAVLQELSHRAQPLPAHTVLYFGCQERSRDFLYADEFCDAVGGAPLARAGGGRAGWEAVRPDGAAGPGAPFSRLRLAFSRADPERKLYVQHLLQADGADLWRLLAPEAGGGGEGAPPAHVLICGGTAMGRAACEALVGIARAHGGLSADGARAWLHELERDKRLVKELWS